MDNPIDPKVPVAAVASAFTIAVTVLVLNAINKEPMDQAALETVVAAVIAFVLTYGAAWLKKTPLNVLVGRTVANDTKNTLVIRSKPQEEVR